MGLWVSRMSDGSILVELSKIISKYKFQEHALEDKMTMSINNIDYDTWVKIRRLIKKLNMGVIMSANGDLDTVNLLSNPKQYKITLKDAFKALKKHDRIIGCSLTFMPVKKEWMNK